MMLKTVRAMFEKAQAERFFKLKCEPMEKEDDRRSKVASGQAARIDKQEGSDT